MAGPLREEGVGVKGRANKEKNNIIGTFFFPTFQHSNGN